MSDIQQTLIYIGSENIEEAKFMSRNFVNPEIKTRAYINTLGAEIIKNYMASEGLDIVNLHNIHSISKILESMDIADILLPNIHVDVRVVFDKEQIFVPKSHFEKNILPDIYAVVKISEDFKTAEFLGYFQPAIIDKSNSNKDYYFITDKQLISTESFIKTIKDFVGKTPRYITEEDMLRGRQLAVALNDHDLTASEEKELLELLLMSDALRESVLEFDNFETLAYSASAEVVKNLDAAQVLTSPDSTEEDVISEPESTEPEDSLGDDMLEDKEEEEPEDNAGQEPKTTTETEEETAEEETKEPEIQNVEQQEVHAVTVEKSNKEMSVDDILDRTIASIDENPSSIEDKKANLASNIVVALGQAAEGGAVAAGTMAAAGAVAEAAGTVEAAEIAAEVSETAMKLAGASGEITNKDKHTIDEPLDMAQVDKVESIASKTKEQVFEHETVDMTSMDIVNEGTVDEDHAESLSDMETLVALEGGVNPEEDFAEMQGISESEVVDLPMTADYTINDDGTSSMDMYSNMDVNMEDESELIDMPPLDGGIGDFDLDFNIGDDTLGDTITQDNPLMESEPEEETIDEKIDEPSEVEDLTETPVTEDVLQEEEIPVEAEDIAETPEIAEEDTETAEEVEETVEDTKIEEPEALETEITEPEITEETVTEPEIDLDGAEMTEVAEEPEISETTEPEISEIAETEITEEVLEEPSADTITEPITDTELTEEDLTQTPEVDVIQETAEPETELTEVQTDDIDMVEESLAEAEEKPADDTTEIVEDTDIISEPQAETEPESEPEPEQEAVSQTEAGDELDTMLDDNVAASDELDSLLDSLGSNDEPAESWTDNTGYDDLSGAEPAKTVDNDVITEPEPVAAVVATENSRVISDKTFAIGEIPIDINDMGEQFSDNTPLGNLYTPTQKMPGDALLNNPGRMGAARPQTTKAPLIAGLFGGLVVLIIVGVVGFFAAKMFKTPSIEAPQPITDDNVPTSSDNGVSDGNTLNVTNENVLNMDNNSNALASTAGSNSVDAARKSGAATSFVDIKKLSWEVPDYISYDPNFKQYFQSVGKSLKLALVSDLLLATDYIYSSPVKVSVTFTQDGTFKSSQMLNSSGSTQIDSIVLQTVNQTLKSVKAPHSVRNDESTTAILKIYF